ncbi:MAG: AarF/UbiB family protein [Myxococcota bacterium]|nr:AarF/UbiB family protein [Myxococcota bacterium]
MKPQTHTPVAAPAVLPEDGQRGAAPRFRLRAWGVEPALRLGAIVLGLAWARLRGLPGDWLAGRTGRALRQAARRAEAARRIADALGELKGAFAKAGQFASIRYDVLPAEVRSAFAGLQDRVPPRPLPEVVATLERELGAPLAAHFESFEAEPLGAASIAQVHRARLRGGETVAVKVQFPWLEQSLAADLAWARWLLGRLDRRGGGAAGGLDRARLFEEFARSLRDELDFAREADVAEEIARNLAGEPQVVVPGIHRALSTRRVLTMSYLPAVRITDREALARLGAPVRSVLETLARAYAKQVFVDGLFHADPHPGNLFVIDEPEAAVRPRVLFVDFGLSRRLEPRLRREMRLGIHALLRQDGEAFLDGMERMDMIAPDHRDAVGAAVDAMFGRIRGEGAPLGLGGRQVLALKDHAKALLEETPGLHLPDDLLHYAKTLSYLFALGHELDPDVDLMRLSVPYLLRFLSEKDARLD